MNTDRIVALLSKLVSFETVSAHSNLALIDWAEAFLSDAGFEVTRVRAAEGDKAGLLARFGAGEGGVLFSAHTDVVPVEGQSWTVAPFTASVRDGRVFGRGSTDMKGFIACVLALAGTFRDHPPAMPVMIALSWDEEVGCRGIPQMIDRVVPVLGRPDLCIVGEPTSLRLCLGHKGKASYRALCHGTAGHSAMAPRFTNALHLAADLISALRSAQNRLAHEGAYDSTFDPPYSTVHAGVMRGGTALNIVPDKAEVLFEIRHLAAETPDTILSQIVAGLPEGIEIAQTGSYPGLSASEDDPAVRAFASLLPDAQPVTVAFGTEAGFYAKAGLTTVVWGPGTMDDGHQPDESIAISELAGCVDVLARLLQGGFPLVRTV